MPIRYRWLLALLLLCLPAWAAEEEVGEPTEPPSMAESGPKPAEITPPTAEQVDDSIRRGIDFLLKRQNKSGSWGSANITRPNEILAPAPGSHHAFRAAVTAMCISALIETGGDREDVRTSLDRAEKWLIENVSHVRRATPEVFYNNWTHTYAIQALVQMLKRHADDAERCQTIRDLIENQIGMLGRYESIDGGWTYYDMGAHTQKPSWTTMSFVSAATLVALHEAKEAGIDVPERLVDRAKASILRQRKPDFSYLYGVYLKNQPMREINRPSGSLGRSQACNVALRLWGDKDVTDAVMKTWLDRLFARNTWLDMGRKRPIPHESWCQVSGYFYYFGHYYAARCIDLLPRDDRPHFQDHLAHILLPLQEKDGSWWDYPMYDYHQQYGTAFALMSLERCRK